MMRGYSLGASQRPALSDSGAFRSVSNFQFGARAQLAYAGGMRGLAMARERQVKVLKSGRTQTVRIPWELQLPRNHAVMRKEGENPVIEPVGPKSLHALLETLVPLQEDSAPTPDSLSVGL